MAQRALPPGAIRRRAVFGLLDADGWTWAGLRATFWFLIIVFMLGYVPNRAYYFTVSNTIDVGYNFISVVNWCPADNEDLPCPAPNGAVLPWQPSPPELALPSARAGAGAFQSGTNVYVIGGETADGATDEVLATNATLDGNFVAWSAGPALPEPRADAAVGVFLGVPYVLGGLDASGQATDTAFRGIVEDGVLTGWEAADGSGGGDALTLPRAVSMASVVASPSGFVLIGGLDASGEPTSDVHVAWVDDAGARLTAWTPLEGLALPEPRAAAVGGSIGDYLYVVGGLGPEGATDSVFRLQLAGREPATDETGQLRGWAVAPEASRLPEPRSHAVSYTSSGAVYVLGGLDAEGAPQESALWAVPDAIAGDFTDGWQRLDQTDLPAAVARAPVAAVASTVFIFGGVTADGLADASMRAGLAPRAPYFQLGIAGATIPALSIKGQVGQQLGHLNAMGVGTLNFVVLILIALAFSHQDATRRIISRLSRGRLRVPPREEYGPS
ncbi:hypothetical protein BH23CHL8_BH23CHL8_11480 [soil metagenome]